MNDIGSESTTSAGALAAALADLERRVQSLEAKVAAIPDAKAIEDHVAQRVQANLPPPVDPTRSPSFKDIELPIPNIDTMVATAKTTWTVLEMLRELNLLFWTLFDRRYHMAWGTRLVTILLLILIMTSHWWVPFGGYDNIASRLVDKTADLLLGLILFVVLSYETRRYKEWRQGR